MKAGDKSLHREQKYHTQDPIEVISQFLDINKDPRELSKGLKDSGYVSFTGRRVIPAGEYLVEIRREDGNRYKVRETLIH